MRVAAPYRTRRGYTVATLGAASLPAAVLTALIGMGSGATLWLPLLIFALALPSALAWWLWPKGRRNALGMAWRGVFIVFVSIFAGGAFAAILLGFHEAEPQSWQTVLSTPFVMGAMGLVFGTVFTFGAPWLLGICVSLLFRDT